MTTTINAAGGDYTGLPTTPVEYRGARKHDGLPWDQINQQYVARGGQVDASVWPKANGKVVIVGSNATSSKANIHTFTEGSDYDEPAAPTTRPKRKRPATATTGNPRVIKVPAETRPEIRRRYEQGESVPVLARAYDVSEGSIRYAIQKAGGQTRTKAEAAALHFGSRS